MKPPRITLYSSRQCPACRQARDYLRQRGLDFQEFDIRSNLRAQKALARLGVRSVPVILVGDTRIDGFDRRKLQQALAVH
jgi:glutaredoxin